MRASINIYIYRHCGQVAVRGRPTVCPGTLPFSIKYYILFGFRVCRPLDIDLFTATSPHRQYPLFGAYHVFQLFLPNASTDAPGCPQDGGAFSQKATNKPSKTPF